MTSYDRIRELNPHLPAEESILGWTVSPGEAGSGYVSFSMSVQHLDALTPPAQILDEPPAAEQQLEEAL